MFMINGVVGATPLIFCATREFVKFVKTDSLFLTGIGIRMYNETYALHSKEGKR